MNKVLQIKLKYTAEKRKKTAMYRNFTAKRKTDVKKIDQIILDLENIKLYYASQQKYINGVLIDVCYDDIIAKSNRICQLFNGINEPNELIVGARFSDDSEGEEKHIITYYIDEFTLDSTISKLRIVRKFILDKLDGQASNDNFKEPECRIDCTGYSLSAREIRNLIIDCSVIEEIRIPQIKTPDAEEGLIISLYKTEISMTDLFNKIGLNSTSFRWASYGDNTFTADNATVEKLKKEIPYMISMASRDISRLSLHDIDASNERENIAIPSPHNEPVIGVIDTVFDKTVYFGEWVDYVEDIDFERPKEDDYIHGTEVSSIIVDGPTLNPELDDECGRFRVKHFGVCCYKISPAKLINKIKRIVEQNPQIHVWNLSLGTEDEVSKNFISYGAAILDEIQSTKNVIFVIAGTNDNNSTAGKRIRIGSPADSLNAVIVNSVKRNNTACSYSRKGNVLSFFVKPDVSYYGGDVYEKITAYSSRGLCKDYGTSLAAPWISRKLCYLIDVLGLSREVAKALLIDSAAGWEYKQGTHKDKDLIGFGVVPIKISQIISSDNSEIRFVLQGTSTTYQLANYAIPIPKDKEGKFPYVARATLCYFPKCNRAQGVDYTNRELSVKFGIVNKNGKIKDINKNVQDDVGSYADERTSRHDFRKWENTKFISSLFKNNRALQSYDDRLWGFCITSKERTTVPQRGPLNFGAVVTLKEIRGQNRIDEFKHYCLLRGYIVNQIELQNSVDIYVASQSDVKFD